MAPAPTGRFTTEGLRHAIGTVGWCWWINPGIPIPPEVAAHNDELNAILAAIDALNRKMAPLGIGVELTPRALLGMPK